MTFNAGNPALGSAFYGRDRELNTVMRQPWSWMCGQRRIGKTSLLRRIEQEAHAQDWLPLYFDVATLGEDASSESLFQGFFQANNRVHFRDHGIRLRKFDQFAPEQRFSALVEQLLQMSSTVVFLWDEVDQLSVVEERDPGYLHRLYAELSAMPQFRFVISSTQLAFRLCELASTFMDGFYWLPLSGLEDEAATALLQCRQTDGWRSELPDNILEAIVDWSGGHPFVLQDLGIRLSTATQYNGKSVTETIFRDARANLAANPRLGAIVEDDYSKLTPSQQYLLREACESDAPLTLEQLSNAASFAERELEQAAVFLHSFGYVSWTHVVRLRFLFYRYLIPTDSAATVSRIDSEELNHVRRTVFISYSHRDRHVLEQLQLFLDPLLWNKGEVELWTDQNIQAGDEWLREIDAAIRRARAAVLIVTPHFLASDFIRRLEVPQLLSKASSEGCRILCLYARVAAADDVSWDIGNQTVKLTTFQGLNSPEYPMSEMTETERERVLLEAARVIVLGKPR